MKIRAIRLREVGIFREPVAIEGFSGGLDVLAGPNELGKSTILGALKRLFLYKPSSRHAQIEQLRPHSGGAPLIEADFEAHGSLWRLRKQFLTGRGAAELTDLSTGRTLERGPEAHARALELIGLQDEDLGPLGLLWVGQAEGLTLKSVATGERNLLLSAIEAEVAVVAGGQAMRAVKAQVEAELAVLVTGKTGKPRANSDYDKALRDAARLTAELQQAREQARLAEERQAELERLRARHAGLTDPAAQAGAAQALASARQAIESGRRAREHYRLAVAARQSHESRRSQMAAEAKSLRDRLAEHGQIVIKRASLATETADAEAAAASATLAAEAAAERRADRESRLALAQAHLRLREQADGVATLRTRFGEAKTASDDQARLAVQIGAISATDGLVRKAQSEQTQIEALRARLDAAAPRVAIAYAPGVHRAIAIAGQPIADGAELRPTRPLVLEIAGVGRVTITPVAATDLAEDQNDLDARRQELAAALGAMGAADLEAAREALAARRDLETQRAAIAQRLAALAPDGLGVLEQRLEAAEREIEAGGDGPETLPPRDDLAAGVKRLDRDYREAVAAATAAERTAAQQAQVVTRLRTTMDALAARCATLDAELIQADEAGGRLQALEALSADATAAANSAVREAAAFAETAPTDEAWAAMQTTLQRHEQALARPAAEIAEVTQAIARIEGDLDRGGDSDIAQRIDELSGALEGIRAKAGRFKQEVDALTLLSRLIEEAEAASQDRFLAPVLARIEPYLRCVLPEARLHLSRELTPSGLARGAGLETAAALSGGTQEQLAVLTRLGFGRLLADRGQPTPVILDDALVYSDDTRIERLFEVLRAASQHHQVIVLTCRSRLFAALGGTPLQITPWKVDA